MPWVKSWDAQHQPCCSCREHRHGTTKCSLRFPSTVPKNKMFFELRGGLEDSQLKIFSQLPLSVLKKVVLKVLAGKTRCQHQQGQRRVLGCSRGTVWRCWVSHGLKLLSINGLFFLGGKGRHSGFLFGKGNSPTHPSLSHPLSHPRDTRAFVHDVSGGSILPCTCVLF